MDQHLTRITASAGTGKTFTLSAYYIAMLLLGGSFRSILAVTFTNKATSEMKNRILQYLYVLSQGGKGEENFIEKVQHYLALFGQPMEREEICRKASEYFQQMMADFDSIHVTTIDSFLQVLLAGLAQTIGEHAGFAVELDSGHVIAEAIRRLMTITVQSDESLQNALTEDLEQKLDNEEAWDIRGELAALAEELFKESVQKRSGEIDFRRENIERFKRAVDFRQSDLYQEVKSLVASLKDKNGEYSSVAGLKKGKNYVTFLTKAEDALRLKGMGKEFFPQMAATALQSLYDGTFDSSEEKLETLQRLTELRDAFVSAYKTWKLTTEKLDEMRLLTYLSQQIKNDLSDSNTMLLAETAQTLQQSLKTGDADFILEKAGLRYRHILLDEFQDTSAMQWESFLPLIEEVLSSGGTALIVGDIKQSIYRFRNGDWSIMAGIDENHERLGAYVREEPLRRNFRSRREVVQFNLETMRRITAPEVEENTYAEWRKIYDENYDGSNIGEYHVDAKTGGHVCLRMYPYSTTRKKEKSQQEQVLTKTAVLERLGQDLFEQIEMLLQAGAKAEDITILVRDKTEADAVVTAYRQRCADVPTSPLQEVSLTTPKSFRMDSSEAVLMVIHTLRAIVLHDGVSRRWIEQMGNGEELGRLQESITHYGMPLYTLVQEILHTMVCPADEVYPAEGNGVEYINCLVDSVRAFVAKEGSDVEAFLRYWDEKLSKQAIPTTTAGSIRIMTTHASKGLEAKHLFIPFCHWPMESNRENTLWCENRLRDADDDSLPIVPIAIKEAMLDTPYREDYLEEHRQQRLDNLNLLYVALTRAADNLFVYCPIEKEKCDASNRELTSGTLMADAWDQWEKIRSYWDNWLPSGPYYTEYKPYTDAPLVVASKEKKDELFEFRQAERITDVGFVSDNRLLRFHATAESERVMQRLGNICHNILSEVETREDAPRLIESYYRRGTITSPEQKAEVTALINRMWENEKICDWFSGRWTLLREDTFLMVSPDEHGEAMLIEKRMDRVMVHPETGEAIVLDYKFGQLDNAKYRRQVANYQRILQAMNYPHVEGYLWMAQEGRLVKIDD